jgi:hypothetical protein
MKVFTTTNSLCKLWRGKMRKKANREETERKRKRKSRD